MLIIFNSKDERSTLFRSVILRQHKSAHQQHINMNTHININNFSFCTLTLSKAHLLSGFLTNPPNHSCLPFSSAGQQPCNSHLPSRTLCWCCHLYTKFATYCRIVRVVHEHWGGSFENVSVIKFYSLSTHIIYKKHTESVIQVCCIFQRNPEISNSNLIFSLDLTRVRP